MATRGASARVADAVATTVATIRARRARPDVPFVQQCTEAGLTPPVRELHFHPTRRWRFDYAFVDARLALEVQGGAFKTTGGRGRHTRGPGYREDLAKLNEAQLLGWRVLQVLPEDIRSGRALLLVQRALGCVDTQEG